MAVSYCGIDCMACEDFLSSKCPGCKEGPGYQTVGGCQLAECCRESFHKDCLECESNENCVSYSRRDMVKRDRAIKATSNVAAHTSVRAKSIPYASLLASKITLIFWLVVPSVLFSMISNEKLAERNKVLFTLVSLVSIGIVVIYALSLISLREANSRFFKAGICKLCIAGSTLFGLILANIGGGLLTTGAGLILTLASEYNEYKGYAEVLYDADSRLSDNWDLLWKWNIGSICGLFGSVLLVICAPVLAIILIIVLGIAMLVVSIVKQVFIYKTAQVFKNCETGYGMY